MDEKNKYYIGFGGRGGKGLSSIIDSSYLICTEYESCGGKRGGMRARGKGEALGEDTIICVPIDRG